MAKMLSFAFWYAVAVSLSIAVAIWALGCTGEIQRGFLEHPKEAGVCLLKIKNETPFTAELRSGHLLWRLRDGLMPHTEGTLPVETGKRYVLTRRLDINGVGVEAPYEFYVAKGTKEYTVIFGGLQIGVIYNRSGETASVVPPESNHTFVLKSGESRLVAVLPYRPKFIVFFGNNKTGRWPTSITFQIDDIRRDMYFDGQWIDWLGYIEPIDFIAAQQSWGRY